MDAPLGKAAKNLRDREELTQTEMAKELGITQVHLSNFENGKSKPSLELLDRYKEFFGVDLHTLAWCLYGEVDTLPQAVRASAKKLQDAWRKELRDILPTEENV